MPGAGLDGADAAFAACRWRTAADAYAAADAASPLPAAALERWGLAAHLAGRDEESDAARERAHHAFLAGGDADAAARAGYWLAVALVLRGERARAGGWFARVGALLDSAGLPGSVWGLFLRVSTGMARLMGGDPRGAAEEFGRLLAESGTFADPDLHVLVRNGLGQALVSCGRVPEGLARLDEVMVAVTSDRRVSPQLVGLMYCAVIATCRRCFDHDRAREWTGALSRWCARQPGLVPYRGQCLVHRAEVLALHGRWADAGEEVERFFGERRSPGGLGEEPAGAAAGMAHYQRGELARLRGDRAGAETAYRRASDCGHDPQPGLALLRLGQGDVAAAAAAVRRALDEARGAPDRLRLLPACVEVALAAGDAGAAAAAAAELGAAAAQRDAPLLAATAALAAGRVALARGDAGAAARSLREALASWQGLGAPYDAAVTRVHLAEACRALGDDDTAGLELDAARSTFERLGAAPDLDRAAAAARRPVPRGVPGGPAPRGVPGGLTPREVQVLRLVATGATNRAVAGQLFLSEKTVARHVANIFLKLGVSSRAAATAFAYEHGVV